MSLYEYFWWLLEDFRRSTSLKMNAEFYIEYFKEIPAALMRPVFFVTYTFTNLFSAYYKGDPVRFLKNDFLRPFNGVRAIALGLIDILLAPVFLVAGVTLTAARVLLFNIPRMILALFGLADKREAFRAPFELARFFTALMVPVNSALNGVATVINGLIQLAVTPIAWVKALFYGLPTVFASRSMKVEDDSYFQIYVADLSSVVNNYDVKKSEHVCLTNRDKLILSDVHKEFRKQIKAGRTTDLKFFNDGKVHTKKEVLNEEKRIYQSMFVDGQPKLTNEVNTKDLKQYADILTQSKKGPQ